MQGGRRKRCFHYHEARPASSEACDTGNRKVSLEKLAKSHKLPIAFDSKFLCDCTNPIDTVVFCSEAATDDMMPALVYACHACKSRCDED